jgi:RNA polymerase sigma-70 factor (ECF subfamily)
MAGQANDIAESLQLARAGSQEALGTVLETCRRYLLGIANREFDPGLRAKGGPSDLVQETFLEAKRDFPQFQGTTEAELLSWLRQMLLHNVENFNRSYRDTNKRQVGREVDLGGTEGGLRLVDEVLTPSHHAIADEQRQELRRALEQLPDDYRQILLLRYEENRSFEEIGQIMQRTANASRKLWGRAVERLQQEFERNHENQNEKP